MHMVINIFMSSAKLARANLAGDDVRVMAYSGLSFVINADRDDNKDEDDSTIVVILSIPFDIDLTPQDTRDVAWAVDSDRSV